MSLREKYFAQLQENYDAALSLMERKNADYAKDIDPFQNFRDSAKFAGITLEQGILVRLGDKLTRYRNLTERGSTHGEVGEAVVDTLADAMNYVNILKTWHDLDKPAPDSPQLSLPFSEPDDGGDPGDEQPSTPNEYRPGPSEEIKENWFAKWMQSRGLA